MFSLCRSVVYSRCSMNLHTSPRAHFANHKIHQKAGTIRALSGVHFFPLLLLRNIPLIPYSGDHTLSPVNSIILLEIFSGKSGRVPLEHMNT